MTIDMNEIEIWTDLTNVFRAVFDEDALVITPQTTADDIDAWDSLTHVQLVVAVEEHFAVHFNLGEVVALENVGQMVELIKARLSKDPSRARGRAAG